MTDKEQIMINGVDVSGCEYLTYQLEEDGQYYWFCDISPAGGPDECEYKPECSYKKVFRQLARKTQECEELKEKLYQIEDVVKPVNKQLPEDSIIRQIMLILNDCNKLEPSCYRKALKKIEGLVKNFCKDCGDYENCNWDKEGCYYSLIPNLKDIISNLKKGML